MRDDRVAHLIAAHAQPTLTDGPADPDPVNETDDEDWAAYCATAAMWSDTWTGDQLEFGPDDTVPDVGWLGGYGPGGAHSAGEWLLLGERMARNWDEAFAAMHAPAVRRLVA